MELAPSEISTTILFVRSGLVKKKRKRKDNILFPLRSLHGSAIALPMKMR